MSQLKVNSIIPVAGVPTGGGGGIVQIKQTVKTDVASVSVSSNTLSGSVGLDVNITPTSTSSKILIIANACTSGNHEGETHGIVLLRGGSVITGASGDADGNRGLASSMTFNVLIIYTIVKVSPEPTVTVTPLAIVIGPAAIALRPLVIV